MEKFGSGDDAKLTRSNMATRQNPFLHPNVFLISCSPACFIGTSIDFNVAISSFYSCRLNRLANPFRGVRYIIYACNYWSFLKAHDVLLEYRRKANRPQS